METTTTLTGSEILLEGTMNVSYQVKVERENQKAALFLYVIIGDKRESVSCVVEDDKPTFQENLEKALHRAKERWQIEVELKEVA